MKKIKRIVIFFICIISSLLFVKGIYGYLMKITNPIINGFSILQSSGYKVRHELMNLDGTTYTLYEETSFDGIPIGTEVSPDVLQITGFTSPAKQTITIDSTNTQLITYQYTRNQYTLTITDSNYVSTTTPSGTYYYGQEIHLIADETNIDGNPFVKWTDNTYNKDYTFTLKKNTTIGPVYAQSYTVTFEPNNGEDPIIRPVIETEPIGTLPSVKYDDCIGDSGDYITRQCTYYYKFLGWYQEPTFENEINEDFVPTGNTTLYAKWTKIFYGHHGEETFDGTNYIDTGIKLLSEENAKKDFIVIFTVVTNNGFSTTNGGERGTIFTDMNEKADPYPGLHFYTQNNKYTMNINIAGHKVKDSNTGYITGQKVIIKKENGIIYYSYDDGPFIQINDFTTYDAYYNNNATFGAGIKSNGSIYRFFKGILSDMSIELIDQPQYKIHFDANGGTGMMTDQQVKIGETTTLKQNSFTNGDKAFSGWNTEADGSGTRYSNKQSITDIGNNGDTITLYAEWKESFNYYVHYDANDGTGTMEDQEFTYNANAISLSKNTFIKDGYIFAGWNTQADGKGTYYNDEEAVKNLIDIEDGTITLYAQYLKLKYNHTGDKTFDGTINTFIDTGINLYSQENIDKNFEIHLTVKSVAEDVMNQDLPTILNCKDESNSLWPGFNIRLNNATAIISGYKWKGETGPSTQAASIPINKLPVSFVIKRIKGVVTISYSYNGYESGEQVMYNQSNWTLNQYFTDNVTFGGIYNDTHTPDRFFKGTTSDMQILLEE